ncbi:MAG TPA: AAA family ATPase, partial [Acidimicrobiales bacterium]|nr:AAA family ATPase [Acidimicrobiales bacterium]
MDRGWPLTGRGEELRILEVAIRGSKAGQGAVLAGPAGVGKTRIAREALTAARRRGMSAKWVTATASARQLPLGALAPLLGPLGGEPVDLLHRATDILLSGGARRGCLLVVDDAHLLDELSATLVHQLAVQRTAVVVLTIRSGVPAPDAITALWKDEHVLRLDVEPLSEEDTLTLLEAVLGGQVGRRSAGRLWALTRGNALFLRHLVEGELEAGRLRAVAGVWTWSGEPAMAPGLVELVAARMGRLSEPVGQVVDLLALGEPLGHRLLVGRVGPEAVEEAESAGLVEVAWEGARLEARLAHPLYGEARRKAMGLARARRLHGRLATVLAATGYR